MLKYSISLCNFIISRKKIDLKDKIKYITELG